jgi:hypothetical protein
MTEVGIGTAIIAYIEPHAGQAQAFNRWYERDHMYAATTGGPGAFAGARWIATSACKAVRPAHATWWGDVSRGSFLTTVWVLDGAQSEWEAWVTRRMESLRSEPGRMFAGRDHLHTAVYRCVGTEQLDGAVTAATALDHPYGAMIAIVVPAGDGVECARLLIGDEVPTAVAFSEERVLLTGTDPAPHDVVLGFSHDDPIYAWRARVEPMLPSLPDVGFASPFFRTIPGTDAYIDEL